MRRNLALAAMATGLGSIGISPAEHQRVRAGLKPHTRSTFDRLVVLRAHEVLVAEGAANGDQRRYDAQTLAISAQQLEYVMGEVYEEEFPELRMANGEIIPIDTTVPEGAETYTYYLYSATGVARFSSAYSSRTSPRATISGAKLSGNVENMEGSYGYTARDLRNAAFANLPLDSMLAVAERRAHMELLNTTGLWGREDLGLPGFINHPNVSHVTPINGDWSTATIDEIIADVVALATNAQVISFGMRRSNVIQLPLESDLILRTRRLGSGDGGMTIMSFLETALRGVSFEVLNELAPENSDGHLTEATAVAYTRDKKLASLIVPMPYRQYPVQQHGLNFEVPTESSTGGVKMPEPMAVTVMEGL